MFRHALVDRKDRRGGTKSTPSITDRQDAQKQVSIYWKAMYLKKWEPREQKHQLPKYFLCALCVVPALCQVFPAGQAFQEEVDFLNFFSWWITLTLSVICQFHPFQKSTSGSFVGIIWNYDYTIGWSLVRPTHILPISRGFQSLPGAHPGATAEFMAVDFPTLEEKFHPPTSGDVGEATRNGALFCHGGTD